MLADIIAVIALLVIIGLTCAGMWLNLIQSTRGRNP